MCENFETLKITAWLRTGVVADQWVPLDAILHYHANRDKFGPEQATVAGGGDKKADANMPLLRIHDGQKDWYYACSWAQPQPWWLVEGQDHWNKRFDSAFADMVDFGGKRGLVDINSGRYRSYHMPIYYRAALRIDWYCIGNRQRIAELLSVCSHIGKKRVQGWGRVARWEVEPFPHDWSVFRDGKLTRGVPVRDARQGTGIVYGDVVQYGIRPSYYKATNKWPLVIPNG